MSSDESDDWREASAELRELAIDWMSELLASDEAREPAADVMELISDEISLPMDDRREDT